MSEGNSRQARNRQLEIKIVHPDLGLGGAERLILDTANALTVAGHHIKLYTAYHDVNRCFEETITPDGQRAPWVRVHGQFLPRTFCGRFHAIFASLRCLWLVIFALFTDRGRTDIWILDQVSNNQLESLKKIAQSYGEVAVPVLLLRIFAQRVVFYCHFPDCLLASHDTPLQQLYRFPLDILEELCIGMADTVVVNSRFTEIVFANTFKRLYGSGVCPQVLYPTASLANPKQSCRSDALSRVHKMLMAAGYKASACSQRPPLVFLSVNRFDSKKNLPLAVVAFKKFCEQNEVGKNYVLIFAGGYDMRISDNVNVLDHLKRLVEDLQLSDQVFFMPSISNDDKSCFLSQSICVLYTPEDEHFGIVPLEAMQFGKPVIACDSGGPKETVVNGVTGYLCESTAESFAFAMQTLTKSPGLSENMGSAAKVFFENHFSQTVFSRTMCQLVQVTYSKGKRESGFPVLNISHLLFAFSALIFAFAFHILTLES